MSGRDRGRPKVSSLTALEDAAHELFLEQGYHHTSIDDIAQRAGISRATFFNYCSTKSDVLWVDVDRALLTLEQQVGRGASLKEALRAAATGHPRDKVPLLATQSEAMGVGKELATSGGIRLERLRAALAASPLEILDVWIVLGAIVGAVHDWALGSAPRGEVSEAVVASLKKIKGSLGSQSVATLF